MNMIKIKTILKIIILQNNADPKQNSRTQEQDLVLNKIKKKDLKMLWILYFKLKRWLPNRTIPRHIERRGPKHWLDNISDDGRMQLNHPDMYPTIILVNG